MLTVRWPFRSILGLALLLGVQLHGRADDDNILSDLNDTDDTPLVDNPWGGVVDGVITAQPGTQLAVDDDGHVNPTVFGPSVAVGDLNGDGLPDLVMADPRGYFFYFPNSGTPTKPKFTTAEVMPIWLGAKVAALDEISLLQQNYSTNDNVVSRIQLVDYSGEKRLSIVAGNFEGKLFFIHNLGGSTQPAFSMPEDLATITVPTYSNNFLWCNFLSPFLADLTGSGRLDLVMGEGTYASNSIYLLTNKGSNGTPIFDEYDTTKIIPGYGREHLTPQVVDWNNDGKPDIICGERSGYVDLFLNTSPDNNPEHLQFDDPPPPAAPKHIIFGGQDQLGMLTTVSVCDLTHNHLPNLVVSNSDNTVNYALNKGKLGAPEFDLPAPIHAVNAFPKVHQAPDNWHIYKSFSMPYVLLVSTNVTDDPSFKPPDGAPTIKSALKIYTVPHQHTYFKNEVYPSEDTHIVECTTPVTIEANTHYDVSFWIKTDGNVENLRYLFRGWDFFGPQGIVDPNGGDRRLVYLPTPISTSGDWTQVKGDAYFERTVSDKPEQVDAHFFLAFNGDGGTVWMTGFNMKKKVQ